MVPGKVLVSLLLFLSSVVAVPVVSVVQSVAKTEAPLISAINAEVILDKYIVVFKDEVRSHQIEHHHDCIRDFIDTENANFAKHGSMEELIFGIEHTYNFTNFQGYSGRFTSDMLKKIRQSDEVAYVEKDQLVYANNLQTNAPWGLSRISHRDPLSFSNFGKYPYDQKSGEGVTIYIIDTGVNTNHTDFGGRARWGKTIPSGDINVDGNGHGTHVAGTTAGTRYGVAKNANVVAVKVLRSNGSGTMSDVVKGIEWVADAHLETVKQAKAKNKAFKGSTANMSLGGGRSRALDAAVNGAVDVGIHFAVAAGNDDRDACDYSPAAAEKAITVGASTIEDERAWFSNYGQCVDIFAPGKDITSAWIGSSNATNTISGTSMAAPHIAGLAAYFLSLQPDDQSEFYTRPLSPALFKTFLINLSTRNILDKIPSNTPNKLAFNDYVH